MLWKVNYIAYISLEVYFIRFSSYPNSLINEYMNKVLAGLKTYIVFYILFQTSIKFWYKVKCEECTYKDSFGSPCQQTGKHHGEP